MAITLTHLVAGGDALEDITTVPITSHTLPANRLCLLGVVQAGGGPPSNVPTVTGWTMHTTYEHADVRRVTLFHRVVGSDTTEAPSITFGGQNQNRVTYCIQHCDANAVTTGTNGSDGIVQALGSGDVHGPSVNATPTLTALAAFSNANNASFSFINIGFNTEFGSPGTGFTQLSAVGFTSFNNMATLAQWKATNDTVHELTGCTNSADMFIGMAVEINHIAAGETATPGKQSIGPGRGPLMRALGFRATKASQEAVNGPSGALATTNADDTLAASGTTTVVGTLARTNANDTLSAAGTTTVTGTLARTNADDTLSASGSTAVSGSLARTNADDTLAASGTTTVTGTVARTNANDTSSASGTTTVVGTLARTNADDTLAASGSAGTPTGSVNVTNASDTLSAQGVVPKAGGGYSPRRYVTRLNDRWVFFDDLREIEELVKEAAKEEAKSLKAKPRTKIKVQPGRIAEKAAEAAVEAVEEQVVESSPNELAAQHALRQMYRFAYQQALKAIQEDEDDALIALLT